MTTSLIVLMLSAFFALPLWAISPRTTEQAIGFYSNGRLQAPAHLNVDGGNTYVRLFTWRDRGFGTTQTISDIQSLAQFMRTSYPDGERLQVGDISQRKGGEISGHASHQVGLDADFSYFRMNHQEEAPTTDEFVENFVIDSILQPNFDLERNWAMVKFLVHTQHIGRMFVDPRIKEGLCRLAESKNEMTSEEESLRRLRPYPNHQDHVHVRWPCPEGSTRCEAQVEPPPGNGCDVIDAKFDFSEL